MGEVCNLGIEEVRTDGACKMLYEARPDDGAVGFIQVLERRRKRGCTRSVLVGDGDYMVLADEGGLAAPQVLGIEPEHGFAHFTGI